MTDKFFFPIAFLLTLLTGGAALFEYSSTDFVEYALSRETTRLVAGINRNEAFIPSKRTMENLLSSESAREFNETKSAFILLVQAWDWWRIERTESRRLVLQERTDGLVAALDRDLVIAERRAKGRQETAFWLAASAVLSILGLCANIVLNTLQRLLLKKSIGRIWPGDEGLSTLDQVEALARYTLFLESARRRT